MTTLRVILNDQLSENISSLENCNKSQDIIFMSEAKDEYTYVKHHKKKIVFLISAMRHFKEQLLNRGYNVVYTEIDDKNNTGSISTEVERIISVSGNIEKIVIILFNPEEVSMDCMIFFNGFFFGFKHFLYFLLVITFVTQKLLSK